jgi:hypothetical protein
MRFRGEAEKIGIEVEGIIWENKKKEWIKIIYRNNKIIE